MSPAGRNTVKRWWGQTLQDGDIARSTTDRIKVKCGLTNSDNFRWPSLIFKVVHIIIASHLERHLATPEIGRQGWVDPVRWIQTKLVFPIDSTWSFMPLTATLIIISFSSPTLSFIPDLKLSFSANLSHCSLSFFFFSTDYIIPQTFTVTSSISCFYFSVFLFYNFQLSFPCSRLSRLMSAFERMLK